MGELAGAVASITGLVVKNIVGIMGILYGAEGNAWLVLVTIKRNRV